MRYEICLEIWGNATSSNEKNLLLALLVRGGGLPLNPDLIDAVARSQLKPRFQECGFNLSR